AVPLSVRSDRSRCFEHRLENRKSLPIKQQLGLFSCMLQKVGFHYHYVLSASAEDIDAFLAPITVGLRVWQAVLVCALAEIVQTHTAAIHSPIENQGCLNPFSEPIDDSTKADQNGRIENHFQN